MGFGISLSARGLRYKLVIVFGLMFVLPALFLTYVIMELIPDMQTASEASLLVRLTLPVGIAGAILMSVCGLLLMFRSVKSIEEATRNTESFIEEMHDDKFQLLGAGDEAEKISTYITGMIGELREKIDDVDHYAKDLDTANRKLAQMALRDALTGLYNQIYIKERLASEISRAEQVERPLSILMLDIDDFKAINDTWGHLRGDAVLKHIARIINENIDPIAIPSRYGGDEFLIVMPESGKKGAASTADGIRKAIAGHSFATGNSDKPASVTISIGVTVLAKAILSADQMISAADSLLYKAKRSGKNKVCT